MNIRNVTEKDLIRALSTPCATLDKKGTVPDAQVAGQVTDVLEFATRAGFPAEGSKGKFYVDKGTGKAYEWSGTEYVESPGAPEFIRGKADASSLAPVATSGNYDDLIGKPTIPTIPTPVAPASATASGQFADALATKSELAAKVALEEFSSGSWAQGSSYSSGDIVFYDGFLYLCSSDVSSSSTPPSEDPTHWDQVTVNYLMFLKADASALRYAMRAAVALVAQNDAAKLVCADRAVTNATIASGFSTLNLTFPAAVSGYVRDFYLRITVAAGESAPAISVPQGITIENAGGAVPEIADGEASAAATTLVWFSETAPGIFTAKSETVKAVV